MWNLHVDTTVSTLIAAFETLAVHSVVDAHVFVDDVTKLSRGYGAVQFVSPEKAREVCARVRVSGIPGLPGVEVVPDVR